jgi:hypothetical protein
MIPMTVANRGLLALLLLAACEDSTSSNQLTLLFQDELVEGLVRSAQITAVDTENGCQAVLSKPLSEIGSVGPILVQSSTPFPIPPDPQFLSNLPRGRIITLDVSTFDANGRRQARGCRRFAIPPEGSIDLELNISGLPACDAPPTALDILFVLDQSDDAQTADPQEAVLAQVTQFVQAPGWPEGTKFGLLVHGPTPTPELISSNDLPATLAGLQGQRSGVSNPYTAITLGADILRDRAICGVKPILFIVEASDGSDVEDRDPVDAIVAIFAADGIPEDDIYGAGVGLTLDAFGLLDYLLPLKEGLVVGAFDPDQLVEAFRSSRESILSTLEPSL